MTDRILPERAAVAPIDCERFDALLPDYLEGALAPEPRAAADAHLAQCARCRSLTDDLLAITRDAAALGPIEPARDLWAGIEARIQAPVVPIGRTGEHAAAPNASPLHVERGLHVRSRDDGRAARERYFVSKRWLAAAAGVLVAVSVGSTYTVMRVSGRTSTQTVAATTPTTAPTRVATPVSPETTQVASTQQTTTEPAPVGEGREGGARRTAVARSDARLASDAGTVYAPAVRAYDKEIATLRQALRQRADLDSSTVAVLEHSLRIIDDAIAQSRRALARDPHSRLLGDQLTRALDQKVELLRTAVLLPSRS
jgi:hypothetical protein